MSKTIEEIINEVAIDFGYKNLAQILAFNDSCIVDIINRVAKRYAQSQTQELQEQNDNLANNLLEMSNSLVQLIKENDNLKELSNTITGLQLQEQNAELIKILRHVVYEYQQGEKSYSTIREIKELLTKYNHLNQL